MLTPSLASMTIKAAVLKQVEAAAQQVTDARLRHAHASGVLRSLA